jgi:hypothetical protein
MGLGAKVLSKALVPFVGGAGKELGALVADQLRYVRWKNAVRILERAASSLVTERFGRRMCQLNSSFHF